MKKKIYILLIISSVIFFSGMKDDKPAYHIYSKNGKIVNYSRMINGLKKADIIFFGELHNNPVSHWLQFELTKDMYEFNKSKLILAAEMFEADTQLVIDEYLSGLISKSKFIKDARAWPNFIRNYQALVEFSRRKKLPFVATNIPRRYAAIVFKRGFRGLDKLSAEAKRYIAPLPIEFNKNLSSYKNINRYIGARRGHPSGNTAKAQAVKDATMAYFINKNWKKGKMLIHFNGRYHSDNYEGIIWYLKKLNKNLKIMNISTVSKDNIKIFDSKFKGIADFIIAVSDTMPDK